MGEKKKSDNLSSLELLYTTFQNEEQAKKVIKTLLERRLIACSNVFEMNSLYHWKGEIESQSEVGCFLKTTSVQMEALKDYLLKNHPYDVPCLINIHNSNLNAGFLEWVVVST